jgi:hypothetical protein
MEIKHKIVEADERMNRIETAVKGCTILDYMILKMKTLIIDCKYSRLIVN